LRKAPIVVAVAATTITITACGGSSATPAPAGKAPARTVRPTQASASAASPKPDFAPYARTWAGHDRTLVIHANGQFLLTVWNSGDPATSSGQLTSTPGDEAIGETTKTTADAPARKGRIVISLDAQTDSVSVSAVNFDSETVNNVTFCGPEAPPVYCGA
jgi:hypothetical protein